MLGTLIDFPDASTTINQIGAYSKPVFQDFVPAIALGLGVIIAFFIIWALIKSLINRTGSFG